MTSQPLEEFEKFLHEATSSDTKKSIPNAAVIAADADGRIISSIASGDTVPGLPNNHDSPGQLGAEVPPPPTPFTADTVCWIASCTKLMTSVAAMQCVERGLLKLDEDLAKNILPEFQGIQVLSSIDENGPVFKPATRKITLRNLLTHSSGVAYEFTHPKILAWRSWFNKQSAENKAKSRSTDAAVGYLVPLVFEPDQGWVYGYGIDWAGVAVSRVSGLSLAEFMDQNIWQPLGMKSTTFDLEARPDLLARLSSMAERDGEGKLQRGKRDLMGAPGTVVVKESGGGGACSTANDYIKLLISLLKNDERLVRKETVDLMFSPSLADPSHLMEVHANPLAYGLAGNIPIGTKVDFGLGGILNLEEVKPTGRASGGMQWGGLPNLFWWINREHGICGCYFGQLLPAGDVPSFEMYERFEAAVNESFKQEKGKL